MAKELQGRRMVVVSPHSDDGVLSLGAAMASWARGGACVELLTVFALDPSSDAAVGGWDGRAGFRTEGEAARARRGEDEEACAIVGATPSWLPFGSVDYERHGDEEAVRSEIAAAADGADALLLPGFPLSQPDHQWLGRTLAGHRIACRRLGLYVEQPYGARTSNEPRVPDWVEEVLGAQPVFRPVRAGPRDLLAKSRAIRRYRSQLPLLRLQGLRTWPILRGERVAWVDI